MGLRTRISSLWRRRAPLATVSLGVGATSLLAIAAAPGAADSAPFEIHSHGITGVIEQVWPLQVSGCANDEADILLLSIDGGPPHQRKLVTWMPCGAALRPGDPAIVERELPPSTVVVDVATLPDRKGPQLFIVSADGIRVESLVGEPTPKRFAIPGGLPLPPLRRLRLEALGETGLGVVAPLADLLQDPGFLHLTPKHLDGPLDPVVLLQHDVCHTRLPDHDGAARVGLIPSSTLNSTLPPLHDVWRVRPSGILVAGAAPRSPRRERDPACDQVPLHSLV